MIYTELLRVSKLITREDVLANKPHLDQTFQHRADVLRSLTQTCRALRISYLPSFYEHVEACVCKPRTMWYRQLSKRLERLSFMLIESPNFAAHVRYVDYPTFPHYISLIHCSRTVTVSLTDCSASTVLPAFAVCLTVLPNLRTLRIMHTGLIATALRNAFRSVSIPQIRTIILPSGAHPILRSCPNVQDVTCNEGNGLKLISAMAKSSRNVEAIDGIYINEVSAKSACCYCLAWPLTRCTYIFVDTSSLIFHRTRKGGT